MRFRPPQLRTSSPADDATAGDEDEQAAGTPPGDGGRYRVRGWSIAFGLPLLAWAVVAGIVVLVIALVR